MCYGVGVAQNVPTREDQVMAKNTTKTTPEPEVQAEAPKTTKSIVPHKYAGRYKGGGTDALAEFIKTQCQEKDAFNFEKFFELCKTNGLPAEKVDHYAQQVADKRHGAQGRARMTLRNMLATIARKDGKLKGLDGSEVPVALPKVAVSGAAAKAKEDSAAKAAGESASAL